MNKRTLIVMLTGLNLLFLATLAVVAFPPSKAHAQAAPLGQNYLMVAGEIRNGVDALYLIDLGRRRLHVLVPNRDLNNRRMIYAGGRDLQRDFRGGR